MSAEYFHVTPSYNKEDVEKSGLSISGGKYKPAFEPNPRRRSVHFAKGMADAREWGFEIAEAHDRNLNETHRSMSVFKVNTKGLRVRKHKTDIGVSEYRVSHNISPERVSYVGDIQV